MFFVATNKAFFPIDLNYMIGFALFPYFHNLQDSCYIINITLCSLLAVC